MGGFYDVTNLPTFRVNNPQTILQQGVNDFRQYQNHLYGVQNVYPDDRVLDPVTEAGSFANPGVTLTLDEVINGCAHSIRTPIYTGAFAGNGTGPFIPSQVKTYYINYLPTALTSNTGTFYPSDYAVASNFGFKSNKTNGYRYYDENGVEVQTLNLSAESHLSSIPKGFSVGPNFIVGRGTEILLLVNDPYTAGQPKTARYLLRNVYDWISAGQLLGPTGDAYDPTSTGLSGDEIPSGGVIMVPVEFQAQKWYY